MINHSFISGKFPNDLKCADVCPIYKKGNALDVKNFRPVSILPSMSKLFEREMVNQLSSYFDNIFHNVISGFRKKHSCETVLLRMIENIKSALDQGKIACVMLMDLSRAFDCIPYKLFISKLKSYGLSPDACALVLNYYCCRKQRVKLGNTCSEWDNVIKGSAQGSLMGPLSYNMFSNDMIYIIDDDIDIYNYADDNTLVCSGYVYEDVKEKLLLNANKVTGWFENNFMKVNQDKFQCIVFGKYDDLGTFRVDNHDIIPEDTVKILGLTVDCKLKFDVHLSNVCQKAGRQIKVLSRLCNTLDRPCKMMLYNSYIECYFNYCSNLWHFCRNSDTYKIEKLQAKALRLITNNHHDSYSILLRICEKSPLYVVRIRKLLETVFKIKHHDCPKYLSSLITSKHNVFNLRASDTLVTPKFKSVKYGKNSFTYFAPFHWNILTNECKNAGCKKSFKLNVNEWMPMCACGFCVLCTILNM